VPLRAQRPQGCAPAISPPPRSSRVDSRSHSDRYRELRPSSDKAAENRPLGTETICYPQIEVRRGIHIAVSLVAVFLLLKPFDCFSGNKFTKEAADCCRKGKCTPSTGDDCCKGTLPGGKQLVASKAQNHQVPIALPTIEPVIFVEPAFTASTFDKVHAPSGSPPSSRLNLPLLI